MRKLLLSLLAFFALGTSGVMADDMTVTLTGPEGYEIMSLSKNGKYAIVYNGSGGGVWDIENDVVTYIADGSTTAYIQCVSNDGAVVGQFPIENIDANTSGTTSSGAVWKDGVFYPLLDEEGNYIESTGYGISPDGNYVCGYIWLNSYTVISALWNSDGTMVHRLAYETTYGAGATAVNNDGVCSGWYYHKASSGTTNRQACIWTADNEIVALGEYGGVSGFYTANGLSENGQYVCASVGTTEEEEGVDGRWRKGIVYDIKSGEEFVSNTSASNYQVLSDGTLMFNMYEEDDDTGLYMGHMLKDGDSISMKTYIEEVYGSEIPSDLDQHVFTGYLSEDYMVYAATSYLADLSDITCTVWMSGISEFAPVRNLSTQALSGLSDKVLLRWNQPFVNSDNVLRFDIYAKADTQDDYELVGSAEPDYLLAVVSLPSATASETYTFMVKAVYEEESSEGVTADIALEDINAGFAEGPADIYGYVYNYNDISLNWSPAAVTEGASANVKYHNGTLYEPFGANTAMTFIAGVQYDKEVSAAYNEAGYVMEGVQFYYNTPVDSLGLIIYEDDAIVYQQNIDQASLDECSYNIIELDETMTLPKDKSVRVAIRVVQSTYGNPIELDNGPAVEGGDMLSEDDGVTWTTMRALSSNTYDRNFIISMVLSGGTAPTLTGYTLYKDGETVATIDADSADEEYLEKGSSTGNHTYSVGANWSDGSEGQSEVTLYVADRTGERCPAPVDITADYDEDTKDYTLTWTMPRQSELTLSNWSYRGMGEMVSGYTGWYQGIQFVAQKMKAYIGSELTQVSFYPISDCDFAIHVYEDDVEVSYTDVTSYTLNEINWVTLDDAVTINAGCEYIVAIEGFDVGEDSAFLGNDDGSVSGYNIYSTDGETYYTDTYEYGNYMIGAMIECPGDNSDADITYSVYEDETAVATELTEMTYAGSLATNEEAAVTLNVAAVYSVGERQGDGVYIILDETRLGITTIDADGGITFENGIISFAGGAESVQIVSVAGQVVYNGKNVDSVNTSTLAPGIYLLTTGTGTVKVKVER